MQGNTNAVIGKGGGSGATVTAINKTGSTITTGQKVWLNENAQTQGDKLSFDTQYSVTTITRDGQAVLTNQTTSTLPMTLYSIGADFSLIEITSLNYRVDYGDVLKYGPDNSMFVSGTSIGTVRVDNINPLNNKFSGIYAGEDYTYTHGKAYKYDLNTGTVLKEYTGLNSSFRNCVCCIIDNKIFLQTASYGAYCYLLDDETSSGIQQPFTLQNSGGGNYIFLGVTQDKSFVISSTQNNAYIGSNVSYLRILAVDELSTSNNIFRVLNQAEMQEDMQKWYNTSCFVVFNPYTGILTCTAKQGTDYGVYKYENGTWTTLPVDLGEIFTDTFTGITSGLVLSDDFSRATIAVSDTLSSYRGRVVNLTTTQGYAAVPYKFYNINENTITGYAGNDTEADGEVEVSVASVLV